MLIANATINLSANVLSAALGLLSVFIFTRLFSPHDYGIFLLGIGFATMVSVFLAGWFRNIILNGQSRDDGTDVRGFVLLGYLVVCLVAPLAYGLGRWIGLDAGAALAATVLAIAIGLFELTQDLLRARLRAVAALKTTLIRAVAILCLGIAVALFDRSGVALLITATLAYLIAVGVQAGTAWRGTSFSFGRLSLATTAWHSWPLTLSLTLLAISSVGDRFIIANLAGTTAASHYVVSLDLVRQTLMMPAISVAAAFFPLAVKIHADYGDAAVRLHLNECVELLLAITLPACLGFALISSHVAYVVLGPEYRGVAADMMPIIALAVLFQVLTQQYLHISFLLSKRNSFYLFNTGSIIAVNVVLSFVLTYKYGVIGAVWARLGADFFGFACALILSRRAFMVPLPFRPLGRTLIAGLLMAILIRLVDGYLQISELLACVVLTGIGVVSYALLAWMFDIARCRGRIRTGVLMFRFRLARRRAG